MGRTAVALLEEGTEVRAYVAVRRAHDEGHEPGAIPIERAWAAGRSLLSRGLVYGDDFDAAGFVVVPFDTGLVHGAQGTICRDCRKAISERGLCELCREIELDRAEGEC